MKNLISLFIVALVFVGCANNQPNTATTENEIEKKEEVVASTEVEPVVEEPTTMKVKRTPAKKLKGTYYRMITNSIEVFTYKGRLSNIAQIDDKKLKKPFYIKGNLVRIEKIYDSIIGDKYGKISGKNLLVSMDDLTKK